MRPLFGNHADLHPDKEAADLADAIDGYLDERVDLDHSPQQEAHAIVELYRGDGSFRSRVQQLRQRLRAGNRPRRDG